jgi:hypothetical protein
VARLVQLDDVKLIQALASAIPESDFEPSDYHSNWNVIPFLEEGPIEEEKADQVVDIRGGIEVVVVFDYHSKEVSTEDDQLNGDEQVTKDQDPEGDSRESDDEPPEGLHLVGTFLLQYSIQEPDDQPTLMKEPIEVDAADVVAFANFNATFNAWPYWREFVQSMTGRMGLPSVVIPVLPVPNLIGRARSR